MAILANNASRIYMGDPVYYKEGHILHHKYFGTEKDGSFTNYIDPSRFWKSLIPAASFLDFNDFRVHVGTKMSRSKLLTLVLTGLFKTFILFYILSSLPLLAKGIFLIVSTWLAFTLDRVRESFEHNLMPDDNSVASRSLGLSFWGIVLGGGPWGQPCHYMHHLFASLPWYSQVIMHYEVQDIYTEKQKQEIFTSDFFYVPKKFFKLLKENRKLMNKVKNVNESEEQSTEVISLIELPLH
jgi:fatty acid desaturase